VENIGNFSKPKIIELNQNLLKGHLKVEITFNKARGWAKEILSQHILRNQLFNMELYKLQVYKKPVNS